MPRVFMALARADRTPIVEILARTPPIPESCQWATFLRNHDELTLEMVTEEERQFMWEFYAPQPRMRLNLGIRRRLAPLLDNDRARIELANSLLFTLPGSPVIYYGDEIGMGDNIWLEDREGVRTPIQWDDSTNAGFSDAAPARLYAPVIDDPIYGPARVNVTGQRSDTGSLLHTIRRMIATRKQHQALGRGDFAWVDAGSTAVAAYLRSCGDERLLIVNSLSSDPQDVTLFTPDLQSVAPLDLLTGERLPSVLDGQLGLVLKPYQYLWVKL
jgi:maltose alpha-D-glucosyltransferase/alpha-amylase